MGESHWPNSDINSKINLLGMSRRGYKYIVASLWKIEECFRIMKTTLEVQPVFHWTEPRIKGHFALCFLAFLLERTLEFKLKTWKGYHLRGYARH